MGASMKTTQLVEIGIAVAMLLAIASEPAAAQSASAALKSSDGQDVGMAQLTQTPSGVLINLSVKGLPVGEHAFHVHAVGKCEPPFTTAGGHFKPAGKKHGTLAAEGHHAGDGSLEQMACIVEFMAVREVRPTLLSRHGRDFVRQRYGRDAIMARLDTLHFAMAGCKQ